MSEERSRRNVLALGLAGLLLASLASCSDSAPTCPEQLNVGHECKHKGLECPYPGSLCGTVCGCREQEGRLLWLCDTSMCSCVCSCGKVAIQSCETLQCVEKGDPCPEGPNVLCPVLCRDSGVPDGGLDGGDSGADAASDSGLDAAADACLDSSADLPSSDLKQDSVAPRFDNGSGD